jgi:hypothetical protein
MAFLTLSQSLSGRLRPLARSGADVVQVPGLEVLFGSAGFMMSDSPMGRYRLPL